MTIQNNGNVGIGTTSPASMLSVFGSSNALRLSYDASNYSTLNSASNGNLQFATSTNTESAVIVGDNTAKDASIIFDSSTTDYYAGIDYSDSSIFKIGLGQAIGTTPFISIKGSNGYVGIGTTNPAQMLQVGTSSAGGNVRIDNGWLCVDNNGTCSNGSPAAGTVYAVNTYTTGADYAEYFATKDTDLQAGEAVCIDPSNENAVKRCSNDGDNNIMGIVSSNPSIVGNKSHAGDPHYKIIGMLGQVSGNVSDENGNIKVGDSLTAGSRPGEMRKANAGESTVGVALQGSSSNHATIQVLISRRNQSLTVEKVTQAVTDNIAAMNIKDQVNALVNQASASLDTQLASQTSTLSDLRSSVDALLLQINGTLSATPTDTGLAGKLTTLDSRVLSLESTVGVSTSSLTHETRIAQLESQMTTLQDESLTLMDFFSTFKQGGIVTKDTKGNVDLLGGNLTLGTLIAEKLCLEDVCVTKDQLKGMLDATGQAAASPSTSPSTSTSTDSTTTDTPPGTIDATWTKDYLMVTNENTTPTYSISYAVDLSGTKPKALLTVTYAPTNDPSGIDTLTTLLIYTPEGSGLTAISGNNGTPSFPALYKGKKSFVIPVKVSATQGQKVTVEYGLPASATASPYDLKIQKQTDITGSVPVSLSITNADKTKTTKNITLDTDFVLSNQ
ncbi:MAG: peptidase G2 autoproteolytic cleavage domain-containing protein [Candidatus Moraniibacteriota bacterium]